MQRKRDDARPEPSSDLEQRILACARRPFFEMGFSRVTMSEIATELGISKKTLYAAFASKLDLLRAMLSAKLRAIESDMREIADEAQSDSVHAIDALLECVSRHTGEITPRFLADLQRNAPSVLVWLDERRREILQQNFGKILREGRRAGTIRDDVSVELVIEVLLAAAHAITSSPRITELGITPKTGFAPLVRIVVEGVLVRPSRGKAR